MFESDISLSSNENVFFFSGSTRTGSAGIASVTFVDSEGGFSCILSPSTAPTRHRNVQVMAIPILCSHFMRVLLCSDRMEWIYRFAFRAKR